jgi:CBS domain-containing protein
VSVTVAPNTPIKEVAHLMADKKIGCVPVVSDGVVVEPGDDNRHFTTSEAWRELGWNLNLKFLARNGGELWAVLGDKVLTKERVKEILRNRI